MWPFDLLWLVKRIRVLEFLPEGSFESQCTKGHSLFSPSAALTSDFLVDGCFIRKGPGDKTMQKIQVHKQEIYLNFLNC